MARKVAVHFSELTHGLEALAQRYRAGVVGLQTHRGEMIAEKLRGCLITEFPHFILETYAGFPYICSVHTVVQTGPFLTSAKEEGITDTERSVMVSFLADNPSAGDLMPGTGGARKVRFRGRGKGKSGGYRLITYHAAADIPVFILDVFGKGSKADLSKAERNELKSVLAELAEAYRGGVRRKVVELGRYRK